MEASCSILLSSNSFHIRHFSSLFDDFLSTVQARWHEFYTQWIGVGLSRQSYNQTVTQRVLGVLSGTDLSQNQLRKWVDSADLVFAADGGANLLHSLEKIPDALIGDLDSVLPEVRERAPRVIQDVDPDRSDADKLFDFAWDEGIRQMTLIGVEGDRLDHMLATLHSAAAHALDLNLVLRTGRGFLMCPGSAIKRATRPGRGVSVIPITDAEVSLNGVQWPLERAKLGPAGPKSLSNQAVADEICLEVYRGTVLLTIEVPATEQPDW